MLAIPVALLLGFIPFGICKDGFCIYEYIS